MRGALPAGVLLSEGGCEPHHCWSESSLGLETQCCAGWELSSTERCDKLLARRVARDEGAVQAGVPISFIAMFGSPDARIWGRLGLRGISSFLASTPLDIHGDAGLGDERAEITSLSTKAQD